MADIAGRDRGQIILIAAFALAVTFVALALLVNSAIFTENLASRGETAGSDGALSMRAMVEENVGHTVEAANRHNHSDDLQETVERGVRNVSTQAALHHSTSGALVDVTYDDEREGVRIVQEAPDSFTVDGDDTDYQVVGDVERVSGANGTRAFRINASDVNADTNASAFEVKANESGAGATGNENSWRMRVWLDPSDELHVRTLRNESGSTDVETCSVTVAEAPYHVDVTGGTVAGRPCDALGTGPDGENFHFGSGAGDEYDLYFRNADQIEGTYSMVVHGEEGLLDLGNIDDLTGGGEPYHTDALYDVTVRYTYETSETRYGTDIRVAPGEPRA